MEMFEIFRIVDTIKLPLQPFQLQEIGPTSFTLDPVEVGTDSKILPYPTHTGKKSPQLRNNLPLDRIVTLRIDESFHFTTPFFIEAPEKLLEYHSVVLNLEIQNVMDIPNPQHRRFFRTIDNSIVIYFP